MRKKGRGNMKATGIVRKIDELGRVVIPKEVRRTQGLHTGTPLEMFIGHGGIIFRPYQTDVTKQNTLNWLETALSDATNVEDRESIEAAISYVKQA
jgi:AbrB family transcriptional regulator, transcriptional pleiotropic regulator of transition state genes